MFSNEELMFADSAVTAGINTQGTEHFYFC